MPVSCCLVVLSVGGKHGQMLFSLLARGADRQGVTSGGNLRSRWRDARHTSGQPPPSLCEKTRRADMISSDTAKFSDLQAFLLYCYWLLMIVIVSILYSYLLKESEKWNWSDKQRVAYRALDHFCFVDQLLFLFYFYLYFHFCLCFSSTQLMFIRYKYEALIFLCLFTLL